MRKQYWVYIVSNKIKSVLYAGITNNLARRVREHKNDQIEGCTKKYHVTKLVYLEEFLNPEDAITAEKKIKGWSRWKRCN